MSSMAYEDFLKEKINFDKRFGFPIDADDINPLLKDHQRAIVSWAVEGGRRAIFAAFGLGKSIMQLETLRLTLAHSGGAALIICPLGVRQEFMIDAAKLGIELRFIRRVEEMTGDGIYLTNYETVRDGKLPVDGFTAVSLDEAGVLRSFGSKTYQTFLTLFDKVPYRFVATATPSPNRYKELIHYAGFLGVMDTGQALTRFFQRDSTQANNLTLYPHKEQEFWLWLNSWSIFLQSPSDLGYDATGYDIPPLNVEWHEVDVDNATDVVDRDGQGSLIRGVAMGLPQAAREKRDTLQSRIDKMMEVVLAHLGRSNPAVSPRLLPEEPGKDHRGPKEKNLQAGPGGTPCVSKSVLRGQSRQDLGATAGSESGELPEEQAPVRRARTSPEIGELRAHGSTVPGHAHGAIGTVRDLREHPRPEGVEGSSTVRGPQSRNGYGSGAPLSDVQLGSGNVPGRSGTASQGTGLSDQIIIWCDLNDEQTAIERNLREAGLSYSSIHGSLHVDEAERRLQEWKDRKTFALVGKPVMLGQGVNLQQSNTAVFVGVTYRFNDFIQACHRIQRFGQERECTVHIIHAESEREVVGTLKTKWQKHKELTATMAGIIRKHGLSRIDITDLLTRSMGIDRIQADGDGWSMVNNDCVAETSRMDEGSVDLIVTSIPFSNHYEYTPSYNDFGHTDNNDHFWAQMDYLTPQLLRILAPGRIYACHVKDRINFGNVTGKGVPSVSPFHAEALMHGIKHGFDYMGMITVVTDVVRENNQTYRLGWSEQCKDGTKMGAGSPEYILLFHKPQTERSKGYADVPVTKSKADYTRARWQVDAHAFWRSSGQRNLTPEELSALKPEDLSRMFTEQTLREVYDYETHIMVGEDLEARGKLPATFMSLAPGSWAPDVWHDVNRMLTLNGEQKRRNLTMHVCPLQFDIVDRLIQRYSNPGELVFDPFGGIGTVPLRALRAGRRGGASELNTGYFMDAVKYLQAEERRRDMPTLFDVDVAEEVPA